MKKKERKDQEQERQPRRLRLEREIILVLNDPALLAGARGALVVEAGCVTSQIQTE